MRSFLETCARYDAQEVIAVATAGLREAPDREMLLERLREETGLTVELLDGEEEARLSYLGLAAAVDLGRGRSLCLDLGGGSTEVAAGQREEVQPAASLPLGAVSPTLDSSARRSRGKGGDAARASLLPRPADRRARSGRGKEFARTGRIAGTIRSPPRSRRWSAAVRGQPPMILRWAPSKAGARAAPCRYRSCIAGARLIRTARM